MDDEFEVQCPFCGETSQIGIDADTQGTLVMDCEVCCNPWQVTVWWDGSERFAEVKRGDGSE